MPISQDMNTCCFCLTLWAFWRTTCKFSNFRTSKKRPPRMARMFWTCRKDSLSVTTSKELKEVKQRRFKDSRRELSAPRSWHPLSFQHSLHPTLLNSFALRPTKTSPGASHLVTPVWSFSSSQSLEPTSDQLGEHPPCALWEPLALGTNRKEVIKAKRFGEELPVSGSCFHFFCGQSNAQRQHGLMSQKRPLQLSPRSDQLAWRRWCVRFDVE